MLWATAFIVLSVCAFPRAMRRCGIALLEDRLLSEQPATLAHGERVSATALLIAKRLKLRRNSLLEECALYHDIGKLGVSAEVLDKPGPLNAIEIEIVREHSVIGAQMLLDAGLQEMARVVRSHHEWHNGKGYPDGLRGDDIPIESRIIAVVDAYDAMVHDGRTYREPLTHGAAIEELKRCSGTQFDPIVVASFLEVCLPRDGS